MATSINGTSNGYERFSYYDFIFTDLADKRTNSWFLIGDPAPGLTIICLWMYFVLKAGPKWMEDRKPFELKKIIIVYNFIQVLISSYIFIRAGQIGWMGKYSWRCEPVDFSDSPEAIEAASLVHLYFLAKMTELLDTIFFVLRKKERQITFLHMYHHCVMPMISWGSTKYYPGGHGTFIGWVNCFVHIIMYSYYSLAALGPGVQKYLWWKKYITTLQLTQFCLVFLHNSQLFFVEDCGYPKWSALITVPNAIFFYQLFNEFYKQAYTDSKKIKTDKIKENEKNKIVKNENVD